MITLLLHATCSKCKAAHEYIATYPQLDIQVRNYLENPLNEAELKAIIQKLEQPTITLLRSKDIEVLEQYTDTDLKEDDIIKILVSYPEMLQRPILVDEQKAVIGRPTELIREYLDKLSAQL